LISVVFSEGPLAGERIAVEQEMTVGRADCAITLNDHQVSRRHALLRPAGSGLHVEDLGSKNGTFVNGARIAQAASAGDGDVVQVGTCELIVQATAPGDSTLREESPADSQLTAASPVRAAPVPAGSAVTGETGGLPGAFWIVTGLVEIAVILTAATLLVYYAVR
jgi:pSer/pThr/pTyr-binding forkhead associated (FHA) protein